MFKAENINELFNLENCKLYENVEIELYSDDSFTKCTVEELYVEPAEENFFIVKLGDSFYVGCGDGGDKLYIVDGVDRVLLVG